MSACGGSSTRLGSNTSCASTACSVGFGDARSEIRRRMNVLANKQAPQAYAISRQFAEKYYAYVNEEGCWPGPADNSQLVSDNGCLKSDAEYVDVARGQWIFIMATFGGGPMVQTLRLEAARAVPVSMEDVRCTAKSIANCKVQDCAVHTSSWEARVIHGAAETGSPSTAVVETTKQIHELLLAERRFLRILHDPAIGELQQATNDGRNLEEVIHKLILGLPQDLRQLCWSRQHDLKLILTTPAVRSHDVRTMIGVARAQMDKENKEDMLQLGQNMLQLQQFVMKRSSSTRLEPPPKKAAVSMLEELVDSEMAPASGLIDVVDHEI